jgi:aminopeptidase-like protein
MNPLAESITKASVCETVPVAAEAGAWMHGLVTELYPICRSITGPGLRETLEILQRHVPLEIHEVPSGTPVLDWCVPKEWRIRDAYVQDPSGRRVIDFGRHNLHVMQYSTPVHARMSLAELRPHLFSLPEHPEWVPYRTSYYRPAWGFCLSHQQLTSLPAQEYEVCIDSELIDGSLSYGELYLPGETRDEVLLSAHVCHPSLANDNLAGVAVAVRLAQHLAARPRRYSYRFLFAPGTIGAIAWLSRNEGHLPQIRHGLVLALLGDAGKPTYKRSRRGDAEIDQTVAQVLAETGRDYTVVDFDPYGYDERQFCSPGFNLPVGRLTRTPNGQYPEYHTSADDLALVQPECLADSLAICTAVVDVLEHNRRYVNLYPKGEPQLGRRGLYDALGGQREPAAVQQAMLWVLSCSDGDATLLEIARRAGMQFDMVRQAADLLLEHGLLEEPLSPPSRNNH